MRVSSRIALVLVTIFLTILNFGSPFNLVANETSEQYFIDGPELILWEGPPREGPRIRIPPPKLLGPSSPGEQGIEYDVHWVGGWPLEAKTAFNYALDIWSSQIYSTGLTIVISATWESMGSGGPLGVGGSRYSVCFSGCPYNDTFYPYALLDKLKGLDQDPGKYDFRTSYNSDKNFYFGLDGAPVSPQLDFVTVALHEIGHGLGFGGSMMINESICGSSGAGCWGWLTGYPFIYDQFTEDISGNQLIDTDVYENPSADLATVLISESLYFNGLHANKANGGTRVPIYAPSVWSSGSSYSHLDYDPFYGTINSLMTYRLTSGDSFHDPGPITRGIFKDLGWVLVESVFMPLVIR
jgi:hypothetical protein